MKKFLFCLVLSCTTIGTTTMMQSCGTATGLNASNVSSIVSKIVTLLGSKLGLNATQSPLISKLLTTFLGSKLNLAGLMKSNPTQYASQLGDIQGTLMSGLGGVLQGDQMSKLMALKPTTNDPKNILSQLFF